jgi:YVTN family beta-propeller protein
MFEVGTAPYGVVLAGQKVYVSNWGGRRPDAQAATGPAGHGTLVRVDPVRFIANEGSVSVIDLKQGRVTGEILVGLHSSGIALSPNGRYVLVANAGSDTVSVIDTRTDGVVETISLKWHPNDFFGASPNALAMDARKDALRQRNTERRRHDFVPAGKIKIAWADSNRLVSGRSFLRCKTAVNLCGEHQRYRFWKTLCHGREGEI